jgi:hypothetical protein
LPRRGGQRVQQHPVLDLDVVPGDHRAAQRRGQQHGHRDQVDRGGRSAGAAVMGGRHRGDERHHRAAEAGHRDHRRLPRVQVRRTDDRQQHGGAAGGRADQPGSGEPYPGPGQRLRRPPPSRDGGRGDGHVECGQAPAGGQQRARQQRQNQAHGHQHGQRHRHRVHQRGPAVPLSADEVKNQKAGQEQENRQGDRGPRRRERREEQDRVQHNHGGQHRQDARAAAVVAGRRGVRPRRGSGGEQCHPAGSQIHW